VRFRTRDQLVERLALVLHRRRVQCIADPDPEVTAHDRQQADDVVADLELWGLIHFESRLVRAWRRVDLLAASPFLLGALAAAAYYYDYAVLGTLALIAAFIGAMVGWD
jgi:hypothetical protein